MGKVILITGISSGFGKYTAELLAQRGHAVYGTVRSETNTDPKIIVIKMDLTNLASIKSAVEYVLLKEGKIDVLINNAGMLLGGPVELTPPEDFKRQIDTNFIGVVHVIQSVLPSMRKQGKGTIINISSIAGLVGLPFQAFYSASKFAIEGLSEALRIELRAFKIRVVVINPGDFHTNNTINRINILNANLENPYKEQFLKTLAIIEKTENEGLPPDVLARKLCRIVECNNPKHRYIIGKFLDRLSVILKPILPSRLYSKILGIFYGVK
jgi:NAD(P)-dependent dehydrogenase (short-subunit alcohol dehydrogenase family)